MFIKNVFKNLPMKSESSALSISLTQTASHMQCAMHNFLLSESVPGHHEKVLYSLPKQFSELFWFSVVVRSQLVCVSFEFKTAGKKCLWSSSNNDYKDGHGATKMISWCMRHSWWTAVHSRHFFPTACEISLAETYAFSECTHRSFILSWFTLIIL